MVDVRHFILYTLVALTTVSVVAKAEHAAGGATNRFGEASAKLTDKEVKILYDGFGAAEDFTRERWDDKLPAALEFARFDKNEDEVAGIFAKLVGMANDTQIKNVGKLAKEEAGKLEKSDNRWAELLKRMEWTKEIFFPSEKDETPKFKPEGEEFERFKKALLAKWDGDEGQKKKNESFYALLEKASKEGPDKAAAVELLRTKYDPKAILAFIDAQSKNGNKELADKLGAAIAWKGENDRNFLEAVSKKGDKVRVNFGSEGASAALTKFASAEGGIPAGQLAFSPTRHDKPGITYTPGESIKVDTTASKVAESGAAGATGTQGNSGTGGLSRQTGTDKPSALDKTSVPARAGLALLGQSCAACHGPGRKNVGSFDLAAFTANPTREKLGRVCARVTSETRPMPPAGGSIALQTAIRAWAVQTGADK